MKKIAMIPSPFLPVPNVAGGAVEYLCTELLDKNEVSDNPVLFEVYTKADERLHAFDYKYTRIIPVKVPVFIKLACKLFNSIAKLVKSNKQLDAYNTVLIKRYLKGTYDWVLFENCMNIYEDVYHHTAYKDKLLFHIHNDINQHNPAVRLVADTAEKIICVSDYIQSSYTNFAPNARTAVLYNCVDTNRFAVNQVEGNIREKYAIAPQDTVIMYSGRINETKGVKELIQAFALLENKHHVKLVIVGSSWYNLQKTSPFLEEIKQLSYPFKDNIIFTEYVEYGDMPAIYSMADILVVPSLCEEAFGMVVVEGMAMKLPIIATNAGGIPELIDDKGAIILERDTNLVIRMAEAIHTLMQDEDLRKRMGEYNYHHLVDDLQISNDRYYDKFYEILRGLL